jgi:hypothetical protein
MEFRKLDGARLDKRWMQEMVEATVFLQNLFYAIASVLSLLVFVEIVFTM